MKATIFSKIALAAIAVVFLASISFTNAQVKDVKKQGANHGVNFVDANGDGICDNFTGTKGNGPKDGTGNKNGKGQGMKKGNGNGNGTGICNGTGKGNGNGTGVCDGTGPKGFGKGRK